jgi:Zn-dependent metalloprotease
MAHRGADRHVARSPELTQGFASSFARSRIRCAAREAGPLRVPSSFAHELTHVITAHTSKLVYAGESGALNESFSDVMGASAEHWLSPNPNTNFVIGERLFAPTIDPTAQFALRDMENPGSVSPGQPSHTESRYNCPPGAQPGSNTNDFCGVHTNSGIPKRRRR